VNLFVQNPWIDCDNSCPWGPGYVTWFNTDGESGIEPPDDVKRLHELVLEGRTLSPAEAAPLAQEIYKWIIDQQVIIGTCRRSPMVMGVTVVSAKLGNVPPSWANDTMFNTPWPSMPEQFYYKR
jgi:peptide/nickel transport system substrate-binding protein